MSAWTSGAGSPTDAELKRMTTGAWSWLVVGGVVSLVVGVVSIAWPDATAAVLGLLFGLWLLVAGMARLGLAAVMSTWAWWRRGLTLLFGLALLVIGVLGLANLAGSARVLVMLIGIGFLVAAAADVVLALSGRGSRSWWAALFLGAVNLVIGLVFLARPEAGLTAIAVTLGVVLIILGLLQIIAGIVVRRLVHRIAERVGGPRPDEPRVIGYEIL